MPQTKPVGQFILAVCALFGLALSPAPAAADFDPPYTITTDTSSSQPKIAMSPFGKSYVVWTVSDAGVERVQGARPTGGLAMPDALSDAGVAHSFDPNLAMNSSGISFIVWQYGGDQFGGGSIKLRRRAANGSLGAIETVSPASQLAAKGPRVATNRDGDAIIVWSNNSTIYARFRAANGIYGPVKPVSLAGQGGFNANVAMATNDMAVVVWENGSSAWMRARASNGKWGAVKALGSGNSGHEPRIAMTPEGKALIVWHELSDLKAQMRAANGALGAIKTLSPIPESASAPQIAMNPKGNALIAWQSLGATTTRILARALSAAGVAGPTKALTPTTVVAEQPQVAINSAGDGVVVYRVTAASNIRFEARSHSAAGLLGARETLSPSQPSGGNPQSGVAIAANGTAKTVWRQESSIEVADGTVP